MFIGSNLTFSPSASWGVKACRAGTSTIQSFRLLELVVKPWSVPFVRVFVLFFGIIAYSLLRGAHNEHNYWNECTDTLEWTLPSPPPEHAFEILPKQEEWDKSNAH